MTALPLRLALAPTMAVLVPHQPLGQTREEWWSKASRIAFATSGGSLCASPFGGGAWFPIVPSDPAEAFETLIARGVLPDSWAGDERRAFDATAEIASLLSRMPPPADGLVANGFIVKLYASGDFLRRPVVSLEQRGVRREVRLAETYDESHPLYSVESALGVLARTWPHPATIPSLVSWASLGPAAILRAEELALHGAHLLTIHPPVVVWRVAPLTPVPRDTMLWQVERQRKLCGEANAFAPCDALYEMGLAWVYADDHAVTIVVPPVGAS